MKIPEPQTKLLHEKYELVLRELAGQMAFTYLCGDSNFGYLTDRQALEVELKSINEVLMRHKLPKIRIRRSKNDNTLVGG